MVTGTIYSCFAYSQMHGNVTLRKAYSIIFQRICGLIVLLFREADWDGVCQNIDSSSSLSAKILPDK